MIKGRRLGRKHTLTVPTVRKGTGVSQAARQVIKSKSLFTGSVSHPGASQVPYEMPYGGLFSNSHFQGVPVNDQVNPALYKRQIVFRDNRKVDMASNKPVTDKSRFHGNVDKAYIQEIAREAAKAGIDPYTMLAINLQETGINGNPTESDKYEQSQWIDNPYRIRFNMKDTKGEMDKYKSNPAGYVANTMNEKFTRAKKMGKVSDEDTIQSWNGYGKLGAGNDTGSHIVYGQDVSKNPIDMNTNPVYGKRIVNLRDSVIKQNPEIRKIVGDMTGEYKKGGTIHINPKNKGKFNATKKATGKSTEELTHSSNPTTRKRAIFAQNARKWHHKANGGWVQEYPDGGLTGTSKTIVTKAPRSSNGPREDYINFLNGYGVGGLGIPSTVAIHMDSKAMKKAGIELDKNGIKYRDAYRDSLFDPNHKFTDSDYAAYVDKKGNQIYPQGGRVLGPSAGVGMGNVYPGIEQFPPEYGLGGIMQGIAPFASLLGPVGMGVGAGISLIGGAIEGQENANLQRKQQSQQMQQQAQQSQLNIMANDRPTFSWGGRLPETRSFSPSGLTLGHIPGYGGVSEVDRDPRKGFDWTINRPGRAGEIKNWSRDTNTNVHRHGYPMGGSVDPYGQPVELEKQEVYQTPEGDMGQVNGPSHEQGGVPINLPEDTFVWSDKLKTAKGTTFADEAAKLGRMKAKYEKILKG
jgi:hypothetical protein